MSNVKFSLLASIGCGHDIDAVASASSTRISSRRGTSSRKNNQKSNVNGQEPTIPKKAQSRVVKPISVKSEQQKDETGS